MSRVLVMGGTGSIGRLVVRRLLELGDAPRVLTRKRDRAVPALGADVDVVAGDLIDVAGLAALDGREVRVARRRLARPARLEAPQREAAARERAPVHHRAAGLVRRRHQRPASRRAA